MTRRSVELPTVDTDRVGEKITLTVEAWIIKIEADLVDVSSPEEPDMALPSEQWTTFELGKATRT
jgi:hypothetical protein